MLLDPSLRGRWCSSSPRVVIELALRQLGLSAMTPNPECPALPKQMSALVDQALALDERDGLNLLLAGEGGPWSPATGRFHG